VSRYCVDTSAYSHFKRGTASAVQAISTASWLGVSAIVLGELRAGFLGGTRHPRNESELSEFLSSAVVEVLVVDEEVASIYAEILQALKKAGTPVPTNDIWIAAIAARHGVNVLTHDVHFQNIQRVGTTLLT